MRRLTFLLAVLLMMTEMNGYAQQPQQPEQPQISNELRLERENILLTARVAELEAQLTQLKTVIVNERISKAAPSLIERLQAAAPDWDVNPNTLEFTRKQTGVAPPAAGIQVAPQPVPTVAPQPTQPRP